MAVIPNTSSHQGRGDNRLAVTKRIGQLVGGLLWTRDWKDPSE